MDKAIPRSGRVKFGYRQTCERPDLGEPAKQTLKPVQNPGGLYPYLDQLVSARYYKRWLDAVHNGSEPPEAVLRDFLEHHSYEFFNSDWVATEAGALLLGLGRHGPTTVQSKSTAKRFFNFYWRHVLSPKQKRIQKALEALLEYNSPHVKQHWISVIRWMRKQPGYPCLNPDVTAKKFLSDRPAACDCLTLPRLELLCERACRFEELSPAEVALECLASPYGMSVSTLRSWWSHLEK